MSARVLIIEDEYALAAALATVVRRLGGEPVVAASGQGGMDKAAKQDFAAVLLDIGLPDMSGLKVLSAIRAAAHPPPVLVITAHGTLENALEARRLGAHEYFLKPLNLAEIQPCLRSLLAANVEGGTRTAESPPAPENAIMVGAAPPMQRCFAVIAQACATHVPVLLHGPRGAGKTLAAQVIHRNSARGSSPLITYRYDEWPQAEAERALADAISQARGSTLLVEEIAALPLTLQALLTREFGASQDTPRLLATTAQPLADLVGGGRFRDDLFYQISVLQVALPPLRERTEDIPALASYLLSRAAPGRELAFSPEAMACLKACDWPGNVRELVTATRHAAAVCAAPLVLPRHLPPEIAACAAGGQVTTSHLDAALNRALIAWLDQRITGPEDALPDYDSLLAQVEKLMLAELLRRFDDKPTRVAAALRMNRATLRRKLRELLGRD